MTLDEARNATGLPVRYSTPGGRTEYGVIMHVNEAYVFVRYGTELYPKATKASALTVLR